MMKQAYRYDPSTGIFAEDVLVGPDPQTDPMAEKNYTLPANCTWVQPVGLHTPKWDGAAWVEAGDPAETAALDAERAQAAFNERNADILVQIEALDKKRIRPLAEGDTAYLNELNEQITALRAKLI